MQDLWEMSIFVNVGSASFAVLERPSPSTNQRACVTGPINTVAGMHFPGAITQELHKCKPKRKAC
jgi:hypothetical protein